MLVFVANYPDDINIRDGMMQRVAAIDSLVNGVDRIYLDISFRRYLNKKTEVKSEAKIYRLNFFIHFFIIARLLCSASTIYVHSVINLFKVCFFYTPNKTILDIHGVVPEECKYSGNIIMSFVYGYIERKAITSCNRLIHVTKSMLYHYENKYEINLGEKSIILPILDPENICDVSLHKYDTLPFRVVYAGGLQKWQNIDLMVSSVISVLRSNHTNTFEFYFCLPSNTVDDFLKLYPELSKYHNVFIKSFSKADMLNFMSTCQLGFVLRDDVLVNRVACPTKLVEYIQYGVLPIVLSDAIGDFKELGYKYIGLDDFVNLRFDSLSISHQVDDNKVVLSEFRNTASKALSQLSQFLKK
ncbi:hypothetical protein [Aeromonas veronii]|uniref:hypothetical protein n=1 Tax=Aeromonas veronii TaxID=654 RepID=UPI00366D6AE8